MTPVFQICFAVALFCVFVSSESCRNRPSASDHFKDDVIKMLSHQIMEQQQFEQDRIRSEGRSGIKQIRHDMSGTMPYYSNSHARMETAKIHDHAENIRTMGVGEFIAVLNGVEFRTRHNDYRLYMPHRTSKALHAMEEIPLPEVPPEVLQKKNVDDQITEMREWFRAWASQNVSHRDYRSYFKPVMCYLEGAWYKSQEKILRGGWSDRHFMDADTYEELAEINRFLSYTGTMKGNENLAYLPKMLVGFDKNSSMPLFAQFSYRMLCQPLDRDVPLNRLRLVDELHVRVPYKRRLKDMHLSKAARYFMNPVDSDTWRDSHCRYGLLDDLMNQIPGLDNHKADVKDELYDVPTWEFNNPNKPLNAGRYHRWYKSGLNNSRSRALRSRGFSDDSLFVALNTQPNVIKMTLPSCRGFGAVRKCKYFEQSASYAFPFELVYMTPLSKWNPYNIVFRRSSDASRVTANSRNGDMTTSKAYHGVSEKNYYRTPSEFFTGDKVGHGTYSRAQGDRGVLDKDGVMRIVRASGHRIIMPHIQGIGQVRQRFPIMPVHGEGSTIWKELEALKRIILWKKHYGYIYEMP